ncbi:MAG: SPOR domain-containing protein [Bacteroidota bacterium]|nr:SPOR domain-containing protein [Bacteroidota bacterium]
MNVGENLYEYLKHNNRAEIPGLGTFGVKDFSAQINELTGTIEPPCRKVVFEKKLEGNKDFITFLSQREFISLQTAETWIKQSAESWISKLEKGEQVELNNLGFLKKGYLGEYTFVADANLNLMDDTFALEELKNVKVYRKDTDKVNLIHTKPNIVIEEQKEERIENETIKNINESKPLSNEEKINETSEQTSERISKHEATQVNTQTTLPENLTEKQETLNTEISVAEEISEQQVASEPKQETIKEEKEEPKVEEHKVEESKDDLQQEAMEILNKYGYGESKRKERKKKSKVWKVIFWIIVILLLLCAGFVGAHHMGWLKNIEPLKPITDKLSYYIPVRQKEVKPASQPIATNTEQKLEEPMEVSPTEVLQEEVLDHESVNKPTNNRPIRKATATTKQKKATETETNTQPKPVEDNTPVLVQNHSKLGFDVVGGTFDSKQKAETAVRKAKSLGYDSYVLSKIKNGSPIYYVSYGSRRTLQEANNLMQSMMNKMGGSYYVISR